MAVAPEVMLKITGLRKSFGGVAAIRDVSLEFATGSITAIIGPNGAGKTTFFNLISGAIRPDDGRVEFDGRDIVGLPVASVVHRGMVRCFQVASLFPSLTVEESLQASAMAHQRRAAHAGRRFPWPEMRDRADQVLELSGLARARHAVASSLSHGDQKLLDIAMSLVQRPKVLLLDEPTAGMGPDERQQMMERIHEYWRRERMTLVFIEHDMDIVFRIAESIRVLSYGSVLAQGRPDEIRSNPAVVEAYLGTALEERAS